MAGIDWEKGSLSSPQRPVADSGVDWESGVISSAEPEKSSLARRLIGDTAVSAVKGAIGLTEVPVGIADMATGGMAGKALEGIGYRPKEAKAMLDEMYSPEQKAANKAVSDAEGFFGTAKAALQNPSTIGQSVIESAPLLLPGAAIARGVGAAGKIAPAVAGGIGEGVVGAGLAAEQMRQNSEDGTLSARQTGAALASGAGTAAFGIAGGKLAQSAIGKKLGLADVDTALAMSPAQRAAAGGIDAGLAKRIAGGAVSEGVLEELPQSMWEQAAQNYGEGKPISEGVAEAGAMGALAGGVMGGGFNALQGRLRGTVEQQPPAPAQEAPRALPAPTYTGTPNDQTMAAEVERANQVAAAQANADAIYAERAAFEQERAPAKLPVTGPLSAAVNVGIDSGATSITSPANPRYEIPAQPRGSFAQLDELASLIGQERADVADRRELAQLVGQERRDQERRIAEAADSRRALDAALADTDRRAAGVAAQESEAARLRLLDNILSSVSDTGNPARQFGNALRRAGYRNTDFTERERQVIQRFSDARAALRSPEATTVPAAPNELDAASLGIRERSTAGAMHGASGRDKIGEAVSLLSQGWKLALNKTLVSPTGKKRKLNAEEFAAVREARAKMINKTEAGNAATQVDAVSDQGRGDVAAGGVGNAQPVRSIARGRSGNAGAPVQGMRAAGAVGNAGGAGSALNAAEFEQVAQEAAQADGAQVASAGDQIAIKSASPSAATIPAKTPAENQNLIKNAEAAPASAQQQPKEPQNGMQEGRRQEEVAAQTPAVTTPPAESFGLVEPVKDLSEASRQALYESLKERLTKGEITLQYGQRQMAAFDEAVKAEEEASSGAQEAKRDQSKPEDVSKIPQKTNASGESVKKTAENEQVESADKLDPAKIRAGYAHRSLGGLGDKVKLEQMWFDKASEAFAEKVGEKAESEEQKALAAKLLDDFKAEYKTRRYRVMRVGETVVSSAVAGRNKFNAAQAGRRGSALDRAEQEFTDWQKGAIESGVRAIRAARSPEQIAAEQQAKADKAAKKKADLHALLGKLLDFKKGDGTLFWKYPVARVSLDKSGYPSSVTVDATDLTDNKFDIARILFDGDKEKLRAAVDEIRASRTVAEEQPSDSVRQNFESRSASPADAEFSATERAYGGRESYDRAKAAGKTKLNYRQWVQVRTPKFKEWFGDWEMATSDVRRLAATFSEAREQARAFQGKPLTNGATGIVATVSRNGLDKMLSAKAVGKSETPAVHSMAVANLDALFERALLGWSKQDSKGDPNIKAVHRFFSPVTVDGRAMLAKMTVKETAQESKSNPLYTVEAVSFEEMENPAAQWVGEMAGADGIDPRTIRSAGLIESMAERVKKFNPANVSKVVDPETGEPLVVYHGTNADFSVFEKKYQRAGQYGGEGFFFTPSSEVSGLFGDTIMPVFLRANTGLQEKRRARAEGREVSVDHIRPQNDQRDIWVVFDPSQIKSATGNNGNFDGGNPDIRESRADGDLFSGIAATVLQDEVLDGAGSGPNGTGNFGVTRTVGPHGERLISIPVDLLRTTNGDPSGPKSGIQVGRIGADNTGNRSQRDARSVNIDRLIDIVRYLPSAVPSPWRSDAAALESKPNGRPMQASHGISDLLIGGPLLSHLKRLIDVPGQRISVMKPGVIFGGQNFKIVDGVIQSIPVDMMNVFVSGKTAAGVSFHNQPVFILPSDSLIENVALLDDISSALRPSYASGFGHSTPSHKNTLKVRRYNDLVKKFKDLYAGASALDIRVVATREEIPDRYRPSIYAEGVYHQETGLVYLVASNVDSDNRLMQILMHEAIGHYGLANMMGSQFSSLWETVLKRAVSSQPLNRNPQPGEANYETVDAVRRLYPEASDTEVAQEVLARMAETMPNVGWFRMAMARIRVWLKNAARAFGLKLEPTMADVRRMVELAGYHVRSGANLERAPAGQDAVFASRGAAIESRSASIGRNESIIDQMRNAGRRMAGVDWSVSEPSKIDDLIYSLQDKQVDLKRVIQSIAATGKKIGDDINAYLQEELFHGRSAKGIKDFLDFELRPLLREMQMLGIDMGDFEEYLWNRHAEERNNQIAKINPDMPDGGSGINTADARAYLAGLSADQKRKMEALAARIDQMNRNSQRVLVESGLEKQETIDAWNGAYQHYVPLQREDVDSGHVGTGKGFSVRGSSSKRAMGSGKKVVDIIANLTQQRERNIVRAEKNRVSNALFGLAAQNPNPDFWKIDEAPKERVVQETAIYAVLDSDGKKIDEFTRMDDAERLVSKTPGATIDQSWADRVTERIVPGFKNRDNVILTRIDGEDHYVILNERDDRAMRLSAAMKNLDMDNMGRALSIVGKATRYLASVNTQYNPVFGVINLVRDVQGALLNLQSTQLAGEQKRVAGYTVDALRGIYADIRAHRRGEKPSSKWAELFEEFQKEGGQTGYRDQYANAEARAEAIMSELNQFKEGKLKLGARAVFGWLSDYNETMENAVRLAAYKTAKEKGLSNQQAASIAKNLTVNFNRKGQATTQINALYAFFNASVQGTARIAETLFENNNGDAKKIRLSKLGKRIISGGIMLGSMQAMLLAAAGFDDDEPPEFVRERNLILPTGDGKYLTLAMPLGFHVIPGIGRIATEFALSGFKDPAKRIVSMFGMFAETFNPVGSSGFSIQTLTPSIVDPFAALAENRDFTGREIYRENFNANDPAPGHTRAKDVATPWSRYLSESINFITGGTDFKPGAFSPSPDAIDYLIAQATGGVGREINKAAQTVGAAYTGDDLPLYKIPLVGRFVGDTEGQSGTSQKFYGAIREINAHEREVNGLRESGRVIEAQEYIADNPVYRMRLFANLVENQVRKLRDARRKASDDGDSDRVRAINDQITRMMTGFNKRALPLLNQ